MSALKSAALAVALVLSLSGCKEIKIENGEIPEEYLGSAQAYTGVYTGKMDGRPGQLELRLDGRRAVLTFSDGRGNDVLHPTCESLIGALESVNVSSKKELNSARFNFDPGACFLQIQGRSLSLSFSKRKGQMIADLSILQETRYEQRCTWNPGNPERGIPPSQHCVMEPVSNYLRGRFTR